MSAVWEQHCKVFANPQGPGDDRPTALQIIANEKLEGKLKGQVAVITGGSSGIGVETVRAVHRTGVQVVLPVRNQEKAAAVVKEIEESNKDVAGACSIDVMPMDLSSLQSVRDFAQKFKQQYKQLNLLIENAGVAFTEGKTADGFEVHFGTNHLAHFVLFNELKDLMMQSSQPGLLSRVIIIASDTHLIAEPKRLLDDPNLQKEDIGQFQTYAQSKLANVWTANEAERRYGGRGLHVASVHPGVIATDLAREKSKEEFDQMMSSMKSLMQSTEQGAACTVWAALSREMEGKGGVYCVDCRVAQAAKEGANKPGDPCPGYAAHAYDPESEKKLWELSEKMVAQA